MARKVLVKVCKPVFPPNGPWRCYDQKREHGWMDENGEFEEFEPDNPAHDVPVRQAMGAMNEMFFYAVWSIEYGWIIKKRVPKKYHWFDAEGNEI